MAKKKTKKKTVKQLVSGDHIRVTKGKYFNKKGTVIKLSGATVFVNLKVLGACGTRVNILHGRIEYLGPKGPCEAD